MNIEHQPDVYTTDISNKDCSERALQRAIINLKSANLSDTTISWIDIELPIKEGRSSKRFDLIGESPDGSYVLCELKFSKDRANGDDPEQTVNHQILPYRDMLLDYAKRLRDANKNFNLHLNASYRTLDLNKLINQPIKLIMAANKEYWARHQHFTKNPAVDFYSINIESDWFLRQSKSQSGQNDTYSPTMPSFTRLWTRI